MKLDVLINKGKQKSGTFNLNYFAQADNIFIMDNHLAAIWCWEKLPKDKDYTIVHIDAHYDLGASPSGEFLYADIDLTKIPVTDLTSFRCDEFASNLQYFMWDNYIHLFNDKYPGKIMEIISITHRLGNKYEWEGANILDYDIWQLDTQFWEESHSVKILNLDIDYFFIQHTNNTFELFSENTVNFFSNWLLKHKNKFDQITIALSPECCGSWDSSIKMANRILNPLDINIEL
jgi:hypothetical protein